MDSGLGSDDEKRSRTKAQKQLQNEQKQLFSSCFIDATSLGDAEEGEFDHRRNDERRQGALIFRSSIPQYSMLQMPHVGTQTDQGAACSLHEEKTLGDSADITTPHNSIVQLDAELTKKTPVGFYVDLGDVEVAEVSPAPPVEKKNIFSMTIDFNVPKREMPTRLSTSLYGRKKRNANSKSVFSSTTSLLGEGAGSSCDNETLSDSCSDGQGSLPTTEERETRANSKNDNNETEIQLGTTEDKENSNQNCACQQASLSESTKDEVLNTSRPTQQFVKLSDLEAQSPRIDLLLAPRMSRSIPEKSWVESPLATFHSASYRSSPRPFHLELNESLGTDPVTESSVPPPRRSAQRLGTDLLRMFLEEIGPDITVEVNGRRLRAHKCILSSRCQYFAAVLGGTTADDVVSIQGYSYAAVHFALCHIYSGAAHIPQSISLVELAALSDMLGLEGLKEVVTHALKIRHCHSFHKPCSGCISGVVEVLPLSATYGLDELYQDCLSWITRHFVEVWPIRTFAKLPRELRDKCYQQHVVHMVPDTLLATTLSCDILLTTMPTAKWAESIAQLALQLAEHCQIYLRQHYAAVLACPSFLALDTQAASIVQLEDGLVSAGRALKLDQACHSYIACHRILQKTWSTSFANLLRKIYTQVESCIVRQVGQASRSNVWMQLEPSLRRRIRDLSAASAKQSQTTSPVPSKAKVEVARLTSSSSDSSRNSSPAITSTYRSQVQSPSLRRSLLMAARSSQAPPSPSTARRTSTLTNPTQSSAAKSTPKAAPRTYSKPLTKTVTQRAPSSKEETKRVAAIRSTVQKENQPKRSVFQPSKNVSNGASSKVSTASKKSTTTVIAAKRQATARKPVASPQQAKKQVDTDNLDKQSPTVRRSNTFLKEEPTVLGKM